MIFQSADAAGLSAFQAARENGRVLVIGANADQNAVAPTVALGSALIDVPSAFLTVARAVRDRSPEPGVFSLGAEAGAVRFVVNEGLWQRISTDAQRQMDSLWKDMTARWQSPVSWTTARP